MAIMGAIGLGVYYARKFIYFALDVNALTKPTLAPAPNRSFPVFHPDGSIVYPEYAYPVRKEIVPIWLAAFIAFTAPFVFFVLFQIRRKSLDDLFTTTVGLLKSLVTAAVFQVPTFGKPFSSLLNSDSQVWLKWLIGGFRPHFYAVCMPNVAQFSQPSGTRFSNYMYDRSVCTGDRKAVNDALESFPSGHSTAAFAGLIFLALYFNAQLKVMSAHNPAYWKMILFFAPILGAVLIAGALTIDKCESHRLLVHALETLGGLTRFSDSPSPVGRHRRGPDRNWMRIRRVSTNVCLRLGLPVQPPSAPAHDVSPTPHAILLRNFSHTFVCLPTPGRYALSQLTCHPGRRLGMGPRGGRWRPVRRCGVAWRGGREASPASLDEGRRRGRCIKMGSPLDSEDS